MGGASSMNNQWRIQDFEKGGSYYLVPEEQQKFLLDHTHF